MKVDKIEGLRCLEVHKNSGIEHYPQALELLNRGEGSRSGCGLTFSGDMAEIAQHAYFAESDLLKAKQYAYLSAKAKIIQLQEKPLSSLDTVDMLNIVLISDNAELLHWYSQYVTYIYSDHNRVLHRNKVGSLDYLYLQRHLALQGKFDLLGERAEYILANPPGKANLKYQVDHEFYLGLATGDMEKMAEAIRFLCSKAGVRKRNFSDSNCPSQHFMSPTSLMLGKIANLSGYELDIEDEMYPNELVKIAPLSEYDDQFDYIKSLDIYTEFKSDSFADIERFTPKPPGQYNIDITVQSKPNEKRP
ncbi:hypothetical protein [Pseudoalteromonas luteoviolacea]|uniref:Uncharacterized protein n=1 Tax=Pseudoalteromonas luteoviolacea S4054 TaxID=1129367 RepID=A0A0F6AAG4_9GAMM|nr:hypothetical protein [Pseudoalteromonas luteoviolacea]AOT09539.1 hypothetical protein S4054249_17645 [Pseudoalteromonas luteoviolacea]AOT14451.1 hypothetical protein S40542_17615 [Pseudoalteromonas luteoviolacea]AOT19367.1 hypothetical protein S4054_17620 [Pseudoalteromonas luteoviolacea]KKE83202.1 hypothetical protein N479_15270 [Pseudoalteromonas luteoviolacea S4054]KZN68831.1 hypothetical protein N481_23080 [Pseudoalteromonas luteoviolacea S4047-1]